MAYFRRLAKNRFFQHGLPFLTLVVGGSFLLKQYASLRYEFRSSKNISAKEIAEKAGVETKNEPVTLESIYEEIKKEDIDNWVNIRGPRPWEDSKATQDVQREQANS